MNLLRQVVAELAATARRPRRLLEIFRPASARRVARRVLGAGRIDLMRAPWREEEGSGLARRRYRSYDQYVRHQRSKLDTLELSAYQERFRAILGERLLAEVRRVLAPGGLLIAEVAETGGSGEYEALAWSSLEDLVGFFARSGFRELGRSPFDFPWGGGVQLRLAPGAPAAGCAGTGEAGP